MTHPLIASWDLFFDIIAEDAIQLAEGEMRH